MGDPVRARFTCVQYQLLPEDGQRNDVLASGTGDTPLAARAMPGLVMLPCEIFL